MKRNRIFMLFFFDIYGIALTLYTIWLGNKADWTLYNLSVVGYWHDNRMELILWGIMTGILFIGFYFYLMKLYCYHNKAACIFCLLAGILLMVGVFLPYRPWEYPVLSDVHIVLSFMAPVCLVVSLGIMVISLMKRRNRYMKLFAGYIVLCMGIAAYLFIRFTIITTVLELFVVVALLIFMSAMAISAPKQAWNPS